MIYVALLLAGILLLIISVNSLRAKIAFVKNSERVEGRVSELKENIQDDDTLYQPVFEFTSVRNKKFLYLHHESSAPSSWSVGDRMPLIYPPGKLEEARPMTYFGLFNWIILLMGLGMALTITGLGYFLLRGYLNT